MSADEKTAAGLVPVRKKPAPSGFGGGQRPPDGTRERGEASRAQYNALEMRGFANGKRSVLEIRNALAAEYGYQPIGKVMDFFRGLEKTGEFELQPKP